MSNRYSIGGYKIALRVKSNRTLLVEGRDDKEFFSRFKLKKYPALPLDIDTAEVLHGEEFSGLGAKAKIDKLLSSDNAAKSFGEKLCAFVDREWEGLVDELTGEAIEWSPPPKSSMRYVTSGHSLENYSFNIEFVLHYLHHFGAEVATPEVIGSVSGNFPEAVLYAAAFSEAVRESKCISRCTSIFDVCDFSFVNGRVQSLPSLGQKLESRGIAAESIIEAAEGKYLGKWHEDRLATNAFLAAHGHLGENIIWSLVGLFAQNSGASCEIAREVASGRRDERRRLWHTWLVESGAANTSMKMVMERG